MLMFVLHHVRDPEGDADAKLLGVYSTRVDAELAVGRFLARPGFVDYPDGFIIDQFTVDEDHWVDGFFTVTHDDG
jgi:homoserine kinase type II